jgi:hypothetical protein
MVIVVGLGLPGQSMYRRLERRLQFGSGNSDEQDDKHSLLEEKSRRRRRFSNRPFLSNIRLPMTLENPVPIPRKSRHCLDYLSIATFWLQSPHVFHYLGRTTVNRRAVWAPTGAATR